MRRHSRAVPGTDLHSSRPLIQALVGHHGTTLCPVSGLVESRIEIPVHDVYIVCDAGGFCFGGFAQQAQCQIWVCVWGLRLQQILQVQRDLVYASPGSAQYTTRMRACSLYVLAASGCPSQSALLMPSANRGSTIVPVPWRRVEQPEEKRALHSRPSISNRRQASQQPSTFNVEAESSRPIPTAFTTASSQHAPCSGLGRGVSCELLYCISRRLMVALPARWFRLRLILALPPSWPVVPTTLPDVFYKTKATTSPTKSRPRKGISVLLPGVLAPVI